MKTCIFCGKGSNQVQITKEHILPKWMKKIFPHPKGLRYVADYQNKAPVKREINGQTSFDMVISRVCKNCNNGWMSQKLEEPLKKTLTKMILGEYFELEKNTLKLLCLWAFKTAIMRALMDDGKTNIPPEHYIKVSQMEIPDGCCIYLACRGWENDFYFTRHTTIGMDDKTGFICAIEIRALTLFITYSDYQPIKQYFNDTFEKNDRPNVIKKIWPPLPYAVTATSTPDLITWPLENKLRFPARHIVDSMLSKIHAKNSTS
ncbi:TPA: HNH endonuclease [Klebsiella pneumoniae]|nr:HNH endonuclease [Klebsiella pneumoniae]